MLYGRCRVLHNVFVQYFASSYAGAFFKLTVDLIGVFGLCSFIVARSNRVHICVSPYILFRLDDIMGLYFHLASYSYISH
jgi:hypothetical protein